MTQLELFDYELPPERIAQYPAERRDGSRLLVANRRDGSLADRQFSDLPEYLREGDVLVLNDSRVMRARLLGTKRATGAHIELFLLRRSDEQGDELEGVRGAGVKGVRGTYKLTPSPGPLTPSTAPGPAVTEVWEALARPARRLKAGDVVCFGDELVAHVLRKGEDGSVVVRLVGDGELAPIIERVGRLPLPPYIRREDAELDARRYQTVYADEPGSAAAPTAGLHFTDELLAGLRAKGVQTAFLTLHVGLGTFRPVQSDVIEEHRMHEERYHISPGAAAMIEAAKREGRRVVCVGTTSVRTLESAARTDGEGGFALEAGWGSTSIFLYPGGRGFVATDALITNFHLPRSTLLMLVAAFYGRERLLAAYAHAIAAGYRFFSYGDAMLIV